MFKVGDEVFVGVRVGILINTSPLLVEFKDGAIGIPKLENLTKVDSMFKVGDEVVIEAIGKVGIITGFNNKGLAQYRSESGNGQCAVKNLKPRFEVKYVVIDNSDRGEKSPIFKTEQQAFDYINKPLVNVGERWKHSDGAIVRISSKEGDTVHTRHELCGRNVLLSFTSETFLEEFTKCES